MPWLKCEICNEEVYRRPSHIGKHVFCVAHANVNAYGNIHRRGKHNKVEIKCDSCGKILQRWPSHIKEKNFCSCECMGKYNFKVRGNPMNIPGVREKHKNIMAERMSGDNNPAKRPDVRERIRIGNIGKQSGEKNPMWNGGPEKCICETCKKEFEITPSRFDRDWNNGRFCSPSCAAVWRIEYYRGENNPNWHGGITNSPYCEKWTEDVRVRARAFQGNKCILCGRTKAEEGHQLNCHHVNFDKMMCCNDGYPIIAVLCDECHGETNGNRYEWRNIFESLIATKWGGKSFYSAEEWWDILQCGKAKIEDYTIYPSKALNQLRRLLKIK